MNANENLPKQSTSLDWFDDYPSTVETAIVLLEGSRPLSLFFCLYI